MISKTYNRYFWLLETLLTSDPLTFEEINMLWEDNPAFDGPLPIRTFHEHRRGIKEMLGVEIECDRSRGNVYYVKNPEILKGNKIAKWALEKYSIPQDFVTFNGMKDRILLEEIPGGIRHLDSIIKALRTNTELEIGYQKFEDEQGEEHRLTFHVQPYALKVFNHRWYLLCYVKEREGLRSLSLDRFLDVELLKTSFEMPPDFDARKYYANVVGIYVDPKLSITNVKIRTYGLQAEYLRSPPLHKSQREVLSKHGEFAEFTYRLCVTPELISQLLAMGDKVEVLEPEELRERMKEELRKSIERYEKTD